MRDLHYSPLIACIVPTFPDPSTNMPPKKTNTQGAKRDSIPRAGKANTDAANAVETAKQADIDEAKVAADAIPEETITAGTPESAHEIKVKVEEEEKLKKKKKSTAKPKAHSKISTEETAP